jgi:hypothetical protein
VIYLFIYYLKIFKGMKKQVLFALTLISSAFLMEMNAVDAEHDTFVYGERDGKYNLSNKWIYSAYLENYGLNQNYQLAATDLVRSFVFKDGKLLFINREKSAITVVNPTTGAIETDWIFTDIFVYPADSPGAQYAGYQDIFLDSEGNVLVSNLIISSAQHLQVWKLNLVEKTGTLLINQPDFETKIPGVPLRLDHFSAIGNVNEEGTVYAAAANSFSIVRWKISNGVVGDPKLIPVNGATGFGSANGLPTGWSAAPRTYPLSEDLLFVDGLASYPTLIRISENEDGDEVGVVEKSFYRSSEEGAAEEASPALLDAVTVPGYTLSSNTSNNGLATFQIGNETFLVIAIADGNMANDKGAKSSYRLFKLDANYDLFNAEVLWTFPVASYETQGGETPTQVFAGLGSGETGRSYGNSSRAQPVWVDVNGNMATIYIYCNANGYAAYEFTLGSTGIQTLGNNESLRIVAADKAVRFTEPVVSAQVFNVAGQAVAKASRVSSVAIADAGIYIVKATAFNGETIVKKVVVK